MRHIVGNYHRDFDETRHYAILAPGSLVNHFALSALGNRVAIGASRCEETLDNLHRPWVVAPAKVHADYVAIRRVDTTRAVVHIDYATVGVAHGDGAVGLTRPVWYWQLFFHNDGKINHNLSITTQ